MDTNTSQNDYITLNGEKQTIENHIFYIPKGYLKTIIIMEVCMITLFSLLGIFCLVLTRNSYFWYFFPVCIVLLLLPLLFLIYGINFRVDHINKTLGIQYKCCIPGLYCCFKKNYQLSEITGIVIERFKVFKSKVYFIAINFTDGRPKEIIVTCKDYSRGNDFSPEIDNISTELNSWIGK